MTEYTRRHPHRDVLKHDARSRPLVPVHDWTDCEPNDVGRYFRCWNCGFVCDIKRDELGGAEDYSGVTYSQYYQNVRWLDYDPNFKYARRKSHRVSPQFGPDGLYVTVMLNYEPVVNRGCPLCGSLNYRGLNA